MTNDFKDAKQGDPVTILKAPHVPAVFKMHGFDGDIVITYEQDDGTKRDAILHHKAVGLKEIAR